MQQNLSVFGKTYRNLTTIFFYGCCAFTVLLSIFSLCVRYSTCNLIPVDHLLPLLYYSIKYVDIKAFKGFSAVEDFYILYLRTRSNCFLSSTISRRWAQQGWHLLLLLFPSAIMSLIDQCQFILICPLPVKVLLLADGVACHFPARALRHKRGAFLWVTLQV